MESWKPDWVGARACPRLWTSALKVCFPRTVLLGRMPSPTVALTDGFCDEQVAGMGNTFEPFGQILPSTFADVLRSNVERTNRVPSGVAFVHRKHRLATCGRTETALVAECALSHCQGTSKASWSIDSSWVHDGAIKEARDVPLHLNTRHMHSLFAARTQRGTQMCLPATLTRRCAGLRDTIKHIYDDSETTAEHAGQSRGHLLVTRTVRQGCQQSRFCFSITSDPILRWIIEYVLLTSDITPGFFQSQTGVHNYADDFAVDSLPLDN